MARRRKTRKAKPVRKTRRRIKKLRLTKNSVDDRQAARAIARLFEHPKVVNISVKKPVRSMAVGDVDRIAYYVKGAGKPMMHQFSRRNRPRLYVSANGRQAFLVGGGYKFTRRGFIR